MHFSVTDILKSLGILILCTLIGFLFYALNFSTADIIMVYILGIQICALITNGRKYSAVSSIMGVLLFNFFFTEPRFSFQAFGPGYPVTFLIMFAASLIASTLTMQVKEQAFLSSRKAYSTQVLLETSRKLQQKENSNDILTETASQMLKLLERTVLIYPVNGNCLGNPLIFSGEASADVSICSEFREKAAAEWVFQHNKRAGATTDHFANCQFMYLAVRGTNDVLAVAGIAMNGPSPLEIFDQNLLIAMLGECALALEKNALNEIQKQTFLKMQQEKLRADLLRAISHDLRTPLTSISGNAGILMENASVLSEVQKQNLYVTIFDDSIWLISLVENLLSITRIENGTMNLNIQPELLEDVITEALLHIHHHSQDHSIETFLADEFLMARMDSRLIIQVIINIVDNAIQYTPSGSHIQIHVRKEHAEIIVEISDDGPGVSSEALPKLFDMFYTADNVRGDGRRGLGLGLSLCKSIILAHGGSISAYQNKPTGIKFCFTLPAEEVMVHE